MEPNGANVAPDWLQNWPKIDKSATLQGSWDGSSEKKIEISYNSGTLQPSEFTSRTSVSSIFTISPGLQKSPK